MNMEYARPRYRPPGSPVVKSSNRRKKRLLITDGQTVRGATDTGRCQSPVRLRASYDPPPSPTQHNNDFQNTPSHANRRIRILGVTAHLCAARVVQALS